MRRKATLQGVAEARTYLVRASTERHADIASQNVLAKRIGVGRIVFLDKAQGKALPLANRHLR